MLRFLCTTHTPVCRSAIRRGIAGLAVGPRRIAAIVSVYRVDASCDARRSSTAGTASDPGGNERLCTRPSYDSAIHIRVAAGIGVRTLLRRLKLPEFQNAYRQARREAFVSGENRANGRHHIYLL